MTSLVRSIAVILWLAAPMAAGQEAAAPGAEAPPAGPAATQDTPAAQIPVTRIATRSERTLQDLRRIRSDLSSREVARIEAEIAEFDLDKRRRARDRAVGLAEMTPQRLQDLRAEWNRERQRISEWQTALADRSQVLLGHQRRVQELADEWRTSLDQLDLEAPEAAVKRVMNVIDRVDAAGTAVDERLAALVTLESALVDEGLAIEDRLAAIDAAEELARTRLFARNRPPLWGLLTGEIALESLVDEMRGYMDDRRADLQVFADAYSDRLILHLSLLTALALFVGTLYRRGGAWREIDDPRALEVARHVLSRPIATALLIGVPAYHWVYPDRPSSVGQMFLTLLLLAMLRILPALVSRELRPALWGLAGLYFLMRVGESASSQSPLHRVVFLVVGVLALIEVVWLLRPSAPVRRDSRLAQTVRTLGRLSVLPLVLSIAGNLLGWVALSNTLLRATLLSGYLGVVLYSAALVLNTVVAIVLCTSRARSVRVIDRSESRIRVAVGRLVRLVAFAIWIYAILLAFGIWRPVYDAAESLLSMTWSLGDADLSLGAAFAFVLTMWIAVWVSRIVRAILAEDVLPRMNLARGVPATVSMLTRYSVLAVGFLVAMTSAGFDFSSLALIVGGLGVGIGFGLQELVNNFVSGLILVFERPIQVGDTIQFGNARAVVRHIGIRASTLRTFDGSEVIVPNGTLLANELTNWTLSDPRRRADLRIGVAYGTDPDRVIAILSEAACAVEHVDRDPKPQVLFEAHGESSLDFVVRIWVHDDHYIPVMSRLTVAVNRALTDAGIEIPFPQRTVHVHSVDPEVRGDSTKATSPD